MLRVVLHCGVVWCGVVLGCVLCVGGCVLRCCVVCVGVFVLCGV